MLPNMAADKLAIVRAAVGQDILDEVITKLITSNWSSISNFFLSEGGGCQLLSIRGMRGRSGRASQTRSRYRSRNSLPPIFRHFSMTLEAYWSMLYSVLKRRMCSIARLRSAGAPCSQICWIHQFPNCPWAITSMLARTSLIHGRYYRLVSRTASVRCA